MTTRNGFDDDLDVDGGKFIDGGCWLGSFLRRLKGRGLGRDTDGAADWWTITTGGLCRIFVTVDSGDASATTGEGGRGAGGGVCRIQTTSALSRRRDGTRLHECLRRIFSQVSRRRTLSRFFDSLLVRCRPSDDSEVPVDDDDEVDPEESTSSDSSGVSRPV